MNPAHLHTFDGVTKTLDEWAADLGVSKAAMRERIRCGWSPERVFGAPHGRPGHEMDGERLSIREWAKRYGIAHQTVYTRLRRGWDLRRALTEPLSAGGGNNRQTMLDTETLYCIIWNEVADEIEDDLPANRLAHAILNALRAAGAV